MVYRFRESIKKVLKENKDMNKKILVIGILLLFVSVAVYPSTGTMVVKNTIPTELIIYGPTLGEVGITYEYTFFLFDSEGCDFFLMVDWDDGTYTDWMGPYAAGEKATASHVWNECGYYTVFAVAKCNGYHYNASLTVTITDGNYLLDENFSGAFPPEGWSTDWWTQCNSSCCSPEPPCACLIQGDFYNSYITSKAVDASNYEKVNLRFFFGADFYYPQYIYIYLKIRKNETSPWKNITPWDNPISGDLFPIFVDIPIILGPGSNADALQVNWSSFSNPYYLEQLCLDEVIIYSPPPNSPPDAPTIDGPTSGKPGEELCWTFQTCDPDGNDIMYIINWGDGESNTTDCYPSCIEVEVCHTYYNKGIYIITAMAKECPDGLVSPTATLTVTVPRNKVTYNSLLLRFLERFPLLERLLNLI